MIGTWHFMSLLQRLPIEVSLIEIMFCGPDMNLVI